ncbi:DUF6302 family protein [Streptomyces violascens]|uniref:DUF6302 family protein n=1 Tax=Streptomyces violascens TaxID=67381 RepID=UPI00378C503E
MLTTTTPAHGLVVALQPAKDAYDFEYFRDRLADPTVLDQAVAVRIFRAPLLAVPVGGSRRGGYLSFDLLVLAMEARSLLAGQPGFPDLRVCRSPYCDTLHTVRWGERAPAWWEDDVATGRFYGYSEAAIALFVARRQPAIGSSQFRAISKHPHERAGHDPPTP